MSYCIISGTFKGWPSFDLSKKDGQRIIWDESSHSFVWGIFPLETRVALFLRGRVGRREGEWSKGRKMNKWLERDLEIEKRK